MLRKVMIIMLLSACGDNELAPDAAIDAVPADAAVDADPFQDARELSYCEKQCQYSLSLEHWNFCIQQCYGWSDAGIDWFPDAGVDAP